MSNTILVSRQDSTVTVSLNRPDVRNAFNAEMIRELGDTFTELAHDSNIRLVVLKGEGPSFSAGADVNWMRASLEASEEENLADALAMSDMFAAIDSLPQPIIGRIHGAALGGGMGLLAVCDVVVAEDETVFGFTEPKLGIIPAVISRFVVPKIGSSWARALFVTGERFDAEVAQRIGLVHWITDSQSLDVVVESKKREVLNCGPKAVQEAKRLISFVTQEDPERIRVYTAGSIARLRTEDEGQDGLRAFLDKRDPVWRQPADKPSS